MPVSEDVLDLVRILTEEGFGVLAGDLLAEVARGREIEPEAAIANVETERQVDGARIEGKDVPPRDLNGRAGRAAPVVQRREMRPDEQMAAAVELIRLSLIEPMRRLAEAERIAGGLASAAEPPSDPEDGEASYAPDGSRADPRPSIFGPLLDFRPRSPSPRPTRIVFEPPYDGSAPRLTREAEPGSEAGLMQLEGVLARFLDRAG